MKILKIYTYANISFWMFCFESSMTLPSSVSSLFTFEYLKKQKKMVRSREHKKVFKTSSSTSTGFQFRNQGIWTFTGGFTETGVHWHEYGLHWHFQFGRFWVFQEWENFPSVSGNSHSWGRYEETCQRLMVFFPVCWLATTSGHRVALPFHGRNYMKLFTGEARRARTKESN